MSDPADHGGLRHVIERLVATGRWIAQRDDLPKLEPFPRPERRIAQRIELPNLEPLPLSGRSIGEAPNWLTAPDRLPQKPQPVRHTRPVLSALVSSEPLPKASPRSESDTGSLFRWILRTEKIPTAAADSPTKEASFDER